MRPGHVWTSAAAPPESPSACSPRCSPWRCVTTHWRATRCVRSGARAPRRRRAVHALSVEEARNLLELTSSHQDGVARDERGLLLGGARRTPDLHDVVLVLLGTGMRIGEALALRWTDLDLHADIPYARVDATLVAQSAGWTPPATSWATATLPSPHATTSPTPAA